MLYKRQGTNFCSQMLEKGADRINGTAASRDQRKECNEAVQAPIYMQVSSFFYEKLRISQFLESYVCYVKVTKKLKC